MPQDTEGMCVTPRDGKWVGLTGSSVTVLSYFQYLSLSQTFIYF